MRYIPGGRKQEALKERHWLPGEGKINWKELIAALDSCGYSGVWMYEVNPEKYLTKFFENAHTLFKK